MRLWTLHPSYLDAKGLVALWREALLAQRVLMGGTRGYTAHPQLIRFRSHPETAAMISAYLHGVLAEGERRGYRFDGTRIAFAPFPGRIEETEGQLLFEWSHLLAKLKARSPALYQEYRRLGIPRAHPIFRIVPGVKREWERA